MNVHMKLQIRQFIESLLAQGALVGFFARVNKNMISQITLLVKTLPASLTNEFFLVAVSADMRFQSRRAVKCFFANMAFVRFFLRVDYLMPAQGRRQAKAFAAGITYKWPRKCMIGHFKVNRQGVFCLENLTALIALVRLFNLPGNNKLWGCCKRDFIIIRCCTRNAHFLSPVVVFVISSGVYISEIFTALEVLEAASHCTRPCTNMVKRAENGELIGACKGHKLIVQCQSSCSIQVAFLVLGSNQGGSPRFMQKRLAFWVIMNDIQCPSLFIRFCINQNKAVALLSTGYKKFFLF